MDGWSKLAGIIIRKKFWFLAGIVLITAFFGYQLFNLKLSYEQHAILPDNHPAMQNYREFNRIFPKDNNIILIGVQDSLMHRASYLNAWIDLARRLDSMPEVVKVISVGNLPELKLDRKQKRFVLRSRFPSGRLTQAQADALWKKWLDSLPFYHYRLINPETGALLTLVYVKKDLVDSKKRTGFVTGKLIPAVDRFENETSLHAPTSGMLYIRTLNGLILKNEIPLYIGLTLLVTGLILWFLFRSFPPIIIAFTVVSLAVIWAMGLMGWLGFKITILTAIIPALIIVIGIPNTIFLINKYQQEIIAHGNQARSLQRVINKTGNAILMTNLTTMFGFITFAVVRNDMLREFGLVASFGILSLFILSILLIPIIYSFLRVPREKHLQHLGKKWLNRFIDWLVRMVRYERVAIFSITIILIIVSLIGLQQIRVSGRILGDLPKHQEFYHDIKFFEKHFGGILPLDFMIDTKGPKRVLRLPVLKRMDRFEENINLLPQLSHATSVVEVVKYARQAFYRGKPKYYGLPTSHEVNFMMPYIKNSAGDIRLMNAYVDSTQRYARITTFMKDLEIEEMRQVQNYLAVHEHKLFPKDKFRVFMTGDALLYIEGTEFLLNNLLYSLILAILLISAVIYWMFRSKRMLILSLIPNLLPLLLTAGIMGFAGVPLKPSTILIFGITLGISVDDTIHYLTKYREELKKHHHRVSKAVIVALRETGISMFYTSIVLFFGFLVFVISDYGSTKALGGLISFTLLIAMFSNLLLLPALLLFLDRTGHRRKTKHT